MFCEQHFGRRNPNGVLGQRDCCFANQIIEGFAPAVGHQTCACNDPAVKTGRYGIALAQGCGAGVIVGDLVLHSRDSAPVQKNPTKLENWRPVNIDR
jgi:hypothetical protein